MERQMSATKTRINFGAVLRYVNIEQQPVIIQHAGKPYAVIMAIEEYERLKAKEPQADWRAALEQARQLRERISARRGGAPLPDPAEILHQLREERDVQLAEAIGLR